MISLAAATTIQKIGEAKNASMPVISTHLYCIKVSVALDAGWPVDEALDMEGNSVIVYLLGGSICSQFSC